MEQLSVISRGVVLPGWLPDESLFSLVSRTHRLWGHPLSSTTSSILFGAPHGGTHHDLPTHLAEFARRTQGLLGDAETLAQERTLCRYFRVFLPASERQYLVEALCGPTIAHLKLRLGLLTSRFRAHHPLKACVDCMQADVSKHGSAYWHLTHQYPGVWICPEHGTPLQESLFKSTGVGRFQWHPPETPLLRAWPDDLLTSFRTNAEALNSVAKVICQLVDATSATCIDTERLRVTFRRALAERGWLTKSGSLRMEAIAESFSEYVNKILFIPEFRAMPSTPKEAASQLGRLLRPERSGTHPIRYFLLIDWLFESPACFLKHYANLDIEAAVELSSFPLTQSTVRRALPPLNTLRLLIEEGLNLRAAASQLGVDVGTVMVWAAQCGFTPTRRPKVLKPHIRAALIADLESGIDKDFAAQRYGVAIVTITRVMHTEPGLQAAWHDARFAALQERSRTAWSGVREKYGALGIKYLRSLEPAAYAWLYRNDRAWLLAHSVPRTQRQPSPLAGATRWDERDVQLSTQVQTVALALIQTGHRRLKLWQLYQQIPELKAKLLALDRLPLTKRAIDTALNTHKRNQDGLIS